MTRPPTDAAKVLYVWPGAVRHYYKSHHCLPSKEFFQLINELCLKINSFW
jgi:hypothetical protein